MTKRVLVFSVVVVGAAALGAQALRRTSSITTVATARSETGPVSSAAARAPRERLPLSSHVVNGEALDLYEKAARELEPNPPLERVLAAWMRNPSEQAPAAVGSALHAVRLPTKLLRDGANAGSCDPRPVPDPLGKKALFLGRLLLAQARGEVEVGLLGPAVERAACVARLGQDLAAADRADAAMLGAALVNETAKSLAAWFKAKKASAKDAPAITEILTRLRSGAPALEKADTKEVFEKAQARLDALTVTVDARPALERVPASQNMLKEKAP